MPSAISELRLLNSGIFAFKFTINIDVIVYVLVIVKQVHVRVIVKHVMKEKIVIPICVLIYEGISVIIQTI